MFAMRRLLHFKKKDDIVKTHLRLTAAAAAILASIPAFAAERAYLPSQRAAAILADGTPWSAYAPTGRSFKLTLNKDGTGSIRGPLPLPMSTSWAINGDALCITNRMISKCLRFTEIPGGFQGWEDGKLDLKISR